MADKEYQAVTDGVCPNCGIQIVQPMWPFPCQRGNPEEHVLYTRMAIFTGGQTQGGRIPEYGPPTPPPMGQMTMTRDWIEPDGTIREQKPQEWDPRNVIDLAPGAKVPDAIRGKLRVNG